MRKIKYIKKEVLFQEKEKKKWSKMSRKTIHGLTFLELQVRDDAIRSMGTIDNVEIHQLIRCDRCENCFKRLSPKNKVKKPSKKKNKL